MPDQIVQAEVAPLRSGPADAVRHDGDMRVAVLSDTHGPRHWKACPPGVAQRLNDVDLILHAGDVCTATVLDELAAYAPVRVVLGNNDGPDVANWGARPTLEFDLDGLPVAMLHNSGPGLDAPRGCSGSSRTRRLSCSATRTSRGTRCTGVNAASIPDRRPIAAASRTPPWA